LTKDSESDNISNATGKNLKPEGVCEVDEEVRNIANKR
jgi:hypothetical protein